MKRQVTVNKKKKKSTPQPRMTRDDDCNSAVQHRDNEHAHIRSLICVNFARAFH